MVRVVNTDAKLECYAPGIVQVVPQDETAQAKFYTVMMYNGQQVGDRYTKCLVILSFYEAFFSKYFILKIFIMFLILPCTYFKFHLKADLLY